MRVPASAPLIIAQPSGRLSLAGPAGWSWQLLLGRPAQAGSELTVGDHRIPLRDDPILALARLEPRFSGRFETSAQLTIDVPARLLAEAGDERLVACLLLLRDVLVENTTGVPPVAAVSEAVALQP